MKRLIRQGPDAALPAGLSFEQEVLFRLYGTRDGQEGIDGLPGQTGTGFQGRMSMAEQGTRQEAWR